MAIFRRINISTNKRNLAAIIIGLSIAFSSFFAILLYCSYELSFDDFHDDYKNIYRVSTQIYKDGKLVAHNATSPPPLMQYIKNDLQEIEGYTSFTVPINENQYIINGIAFRANNIWCDSSFFKLLTFPILAGNTRMPISQNSFLISERISKKYFKKQNPVGQTITIKEPMNIYKSQTITGIFQLPPNSHLDFDIIIPKDAFPVMKDKLFNDWNYQKAYGYIHTQGNINKNELENKILSVFNSHRSSDLKKNHLEYKFTLQRIDEIYLSSNLNYEVKNNAKLSNIHFLIFVAFLVLVLAYFNYNNLLAAQLNNCTKYVLIHKVLGARKKTLFWNFLVESFIHNIFSIFIAIVTVALILPSLNQFVGKNLDYHILNNSFFLIITISTILIGTLFSGIYPSMKIANFKLPEIIKGKNSNPKKEARIKNIFLVLQISVSLSILILTLLVSEQMSFMKNYDIGFNKNNIIVIEHPESSKEVQSKSLSSFKNEGLKYPQVERITATTDYPGKNIKFRNTVNVTQNQSFRSDIIFSDVDYFDIFNLNVISGRKFSKDIISDQNQIMINEVAAGLLNCKKYDDLIGKKLKIRGIWREIIGVVKNYNHLSLNYNIKPLYPLKKAW